MTAPETLINKNLDHMRLFQERSYSSLTFPQIYAWSSGIAEDWISRDMIKLSKLNHEKEKKIIMWTEKWEEIYKKQNKI